MPLSAGTRVMQFFNVSWDGCILELLTALLQQCTLVLRDRLDFSLTLGTVECALLTPSALATVDPEDFPQLHTVFCGGERLSFELAQRWSRVVALYNGYGPSEATICTHVSRVHPNVEIVSIGRPNINTLCHIVDKDMQRVPIGMGGQLCVSGALASGYISHGEISSGKAANASAFVPNPFSAGSDVSRVVDEETIYLTGDHARWLPNGEVEFIGRQDTQIKLRGYRIELSEIESHLEALACVQSVVVELVQQELQAVVVLQPDAAANAHEIDLAFLLASQSSIASYMIPTQFVFLDTLPAMGNDKVDRKAIRALLEQRKHADVTANVNSGAGDEVLDPKLVLMVELFEQVLNESVGADEDFFVHGGTSLGAIRLRYRIKKAGFEGIAVHDIMRLRTPRRLFQHSLSHMQMQQQPQGEEASSVDDAADADDFGVFVTQSQQHDQLGLEAHVDVSFAQEQMLMVHDLQASSSSSYSVPLCVELPHELTLVQVQSAVDGLVARHASLRTLFHRSNDVESAGDSRYLQSLVEASPSLVPVHFTNIESGSDEHVRKCIDAANDVPFDTLFSTSPLVRATLFRNDEDHRSVLLLVFHHALVDGISVAALLKQELSAELLNESVHTSTSCVRQFSRWQRALSHASLALRVAATVLV